MNRISTPRWIRSTRVLVAAISLGLAGSVVAAPVVDGSALDMADVRWGSAYELGSASKSQSGARALTLASADVDADGYPELFSGYALDGGGLISVNRGNREAWAPSTTQSLALLKSGQFPSGFLREASAVKVPVAPELMVTGDFDHDGRADLVVAQRGDSAVYLMRGTAAGLAAPQKLAQSGGVDALAAGEIDRPDGFADLAVAVSGKSGASLQIYAAGIDAKARTQPLPAAASELHVGQIDASPMGDLAVLSAGKVLLLHGVDRSTRSAPGDTLESLDFDFPVQAMALGNFIWDRDGSTELALLRDDGSIQIAVRGSLKTAPFTVDEVRAKRRAQIAATSSAIKTWQPGSDAGWRIAESLPGLMSKASTGAAPRLMRAHLSNQSADDLLAVDTLGRSINVLSFDGTKYSRSQLPANLTPAAVMALQTSVLPRSGLIVLGGGSAPATVLPAAPTASFTVTKTADTNDGFCNADCSLREAITAANALAGADSIVVPAGTYELTRTNGGGINEDNNVTGDLDVNDLTTITGAGSATTIIQAGTNTSNGIDKVLAFNPFCVSAVTSSISGVTVRFGRNSQPSGALDFSFTGGGIDVCNTGAGGFTMTDVVVDQNTNLNGYGGGVNLDSFAANGTYSISNSTISGNRTTSAASVLKSGGGINLFADQHSVNITNTTISGNTSAAEGGGVFLRHTNGGAITLSGSTISNNIAASRGGGVSNINLGVSTLTINNDSVISGNVSQGTASGTESRGGGVYVGSAGSTTIREVSITGNQASTGTSQLGGGIAAISGTITAQFNRISGNTAAAGSGFHNAGATVTGTRNWWGCNAGPGAAPCDRSINASGTLGTTPHLILRHAASPSTIFVTQTSTLTADFLRDSGGGVISVADLDALIGTSKVFNGAVLGGLSAAQTSIQANGTATATFTATGAGTGGANSVVDAHTETAAITINRFNSTTLITSDLPDPSIVGAAVPVNFTVTPVAPGVIAPTGNVVVTVSGGAETCTGTVAAGTCSITLTVGGSRTLTATYSGDTLYNPSSDTELHSVVVCPSTVVTNGSDAGPGSLRDIIANACEPSTITFQAGVTTVTLTSAEILVDKNMTIDGGAGVTVARSSAGGTPNFRIFNIQTGKTVSMNNLRVQNGNHPVQAGGIENNGTLNLNNMEISGNRSAQSGGIQNNNVLVLNNSTISGNTATLFGGGLAIFGPTTTLTNCTITGNQADSDSGGIGASGTVSITNCTIARNTTVISNGVGAGITANAATITLRNSIVAANTNGNSAEANIDGTVQATSAFNVIGAGPAGGLTNGVNNNQVGVTPTVLSLGVFGNYGGATSTLPLLPGSPAINTGTNASAPAVDQRGIVRPQQTGIDIGAFESRGFTMALTGGDAQSAIVSTAFTNPLVATVTAIAPGEPVQGGRVTFTPPGAGASAAIATSPATINASGVASVNATANATVGSYNVAASSSGSTGVSFALQNRLASADLSITKTDGVTTAVPGTSVTYTITASNAGPDPTNATVTDTFPAIQTCTWTCAATGGATCAANGSGNINNAVFLPVSGTAVYTASCSIAPSATGSMSNTATVSGPLNDVNPGNNSATDVDTLAPAADLGITKTDGVASVFAGGNTTYTITTSNAGPSNAPGTTVSDTFPASLTCTWTCVGAGGGTCTAAGAGNINDTVNLPAGGSVTHTASCAISAGASGSLVNTATVTAPGGVTDNNGANNAATDTDTITALPTLSVNDVAVTEGNAGTGILTFTVTRTGPAAGAVGFNFATSDGTATTGNADYVASSGTGSIASGGATGTTTISVTINGDAFFENNETFNVTLSAPTGAVIADGTGVGTINNDDAAPTLAINDVSITEGNSGTQNLVFTVTRSGLTNLPADFSAATANGTATAPSDYLAALVGSTSIAAGGPTGTTTLSATINGDFVVEANETFVVNLTAPNNATIADSQGTGTINNDDTAGIVLVQSGGSTDVTEGGVTDSYTLVLSSQPTSNVSVALNPDGQVTAATSPVVFTPANWATPQPVTVTAVDDVIVEGSHTGTITHTVTSSDPIYNGFAVANVVANVTDNDLPTLAINDVSIAEGNSGTQILTFTVTRTGPSASAVGFTFATADDTATIAGSDYLAAGGTGTIAGGGVSGTTTVSVTINGDATFENTESFFVNLTAPTNATIADAQGVGTITNDDTAPTLAINDVSIVEGNTGTQNLVFTVTRTGLTALPASFTAATADGFATAPSDYLAALVGSTTIAAGGATGTTTLSATINGDFVVETNETFFVNLSAPANATISDNQGLGTITNDDTAGISVVQSGGTTNVTEGGATDTYTVVLTSQPTADVSIALNGGTQVTPSPTPLVFTSANWNLPQTVTVTAVDDPVIEGNHAGSITSAVTSVNGIYNGFVVAPVSVAITDNDTPGVTLVESAGNTLVAEGGSTDTYTMVLTSQPSANVTVTPNGGAQLASPPAVVFTNGNWNVPQAVTVTATDDNVVEGTHSGSITHTVTSADNNYAGLVVGQVTGSITDNDSAVVAFSPASVSQTEATSPMAFTVTLSNPVASGVTVTVNSAPGTATAADFTPIVAGTVSFAANSTASQTVNVAISNDALDEDDETFTLTLSGPTATGNVTLGTAVATGTILDDDLPPVISITSPSQLEGNAGNTPMNFVVSLSAISGRNVSFTRATADGTATLADGDYVQLLPAGATILAGETSLTIPVQIVGNTVFEGNETFSLNLTGIVNATPTSLTGTGTIEDDDQQPTTTTITSDTPDPSVVGQPYAVAVTVTAQTTSPLGTVIISDGSATCGPVTLTTGTTPTSSATCNLTSTTAGAKTLVATYTAASTAFADSVSVGAPHQVNAAATSISVVGPVRSRINQPTTFTFALSVTAPGAGSPAGTVTLSSGAASCNVTVPTMTPSCALSFNTLGPRTVTAAFVPSNGNFLGSSASGAGNAQTLVFALSDIEVTKGDAVGTYVPGELLVYTVTVRNLGADAAANIRVRDLIPAGLVDVVWSCDASGGVVCPQAGGSGDLDATIGAFPVAALLNYTFYGNVSGSPAQIVNTALVELPADTTIEDPVSGNNSASDTNVLEFLFRNGFEDPLVNAPTGAYRLPSTALREALNDVARVVYTLDDANGEALRVYARVFNGEVQYALAGRASNGLLRLTGWRGFATEPTLSWTATAVDRGWLLQGVDLR